ncbi:MAG: class I SAM-dependent methyltransferase [Lachnospiraceae bacterium]|nr:class I SAM-dependent methyltransferase [Lachnospiraceae bacterium]
MEDVILVNDKTQYGQDALSLAKDNMILKVDFTDMLKRTSHNRIYSELLIKAVGKKMLAEDTLVLDATAGLGEDAFLLASAGLKVMMYERDETIAKLLEDGLKRASLIEELSQIISRMELIVADSIEAMEDHRINPDIVYLDPMFPQRNKSGLIKKKFQILQQLESPCDEEDRLLNAALNTDAKKIIIKRPLKGEYLAGVKPSYSLKGRAIRYDCISR